MNDEPTTAERSGDERAWQHRLLRDIVRHGGVWVAVLLAASLCLAVANTLLPALIGQAVDAVLGGHDAGRWLAWCGLLIGVLVAFDALDDMAAAASGARSTAWLRRTVVRHVLRIGARNGRRFTSGDLVARLVGNAADAGQLATVAVWAIAALVPAVGGVVALALIDPWLCLTFLVGAPILLLMVRSCSRDASDVAARYLDVQGRIAARLNDALAGARTISAAGTAQREADRVLASLPQLHHSGMGMWRIQSRAAAQEALLLPLLEVAVLAVAGYELTRGRISVGEVLAAVQYVALASGLGTAITVVAKLARTRAAADRTAEVLAEPAVRYGTASLPPGGGRVEFQGVTVRSDDGGGLRELDLVVPGGSSVAVVGRSGAGKSLLAALAGRLTDPDQGEVCLDGVALPQLAHDELRRAVCFGFERPVLIGQTLAAAVEFGVSVPGGTAVHDAARAARADDFIRRLPRGYDTPLEQVRISGGETQRVGLARAFAHVGRVLVLDDVAASLDTVTEHHISAALTEEFAGLTRIVVAHRASTAARAELVVWLDDGGLRAFAPHHELWRDPDYRALFDPDAGRRIEARAALPGST